jgi:hypothetical protein
VPDKALWKIIFGVTDHHPVQRDETVMQRRATVMKRNATFRETPRCVELPGFPPLFAVVQPMQPN